MQSSTFYHRAPCSEHGAAFFLRVGLLLLSYIDNVGLHLERQVMLGNIWVGFVELLRFHAQLTTKLGRSPSRTSHRAELRKRELLHIVVSSLFSEWH